MELFDDHVMVALLPITTDWCNLELPHLTLVYAGMTQDLSPMNYNTLAKLTMDIANEFLPVTLKVLGIETFGDDPDKVDVLRLQPNENIMRMRKLVETWSVSKHPFRPHCTIGPSGETNITKPAYLAFDRILVAWGDKHLSFKLKGTKG